MNCHIWAFGTPGVWAASDKTLPIVLQNSSPMGSWVSIYRNIRSISPMKKRKSQGENFEEK